MEQFRQIPKDGKEIPEYIKAIAPHTQLTKWGEMRMAAFPVEAIVFALSQYQNGPILLYDCDKWCEKNGIRPDWTYTKMLNKKHNMPPRAYLFEEDGFTGEAPAQQPKKYNRNTADNSKGGRLPIWKPEEKVIDYAKEYEEFEKAKREDPIFAANLAKLTKMTNPFAVHLTKVVTTQMGMAATQKFTSPPGEPEDIGAQECSQPIHMLRDESNPLAKRIKERMAKMRERDRYR